MVTIMVIMHVRFRYTFMDELTNIPLHTMIKPRNGLIMGPWMLMENEDVLAKPHSMH